MIRVLRIALALLPAFFSIQFAWAQGSAAPSYCTIISASNVGNYGMGIQNVTLNTSAIPSQINNTTSAGNGTPIYFDYTSQVLRASANETVNYSIKGGNSNQTLFRIYIDYNNDGTFSTSGSELVYTSANLTTANTVVTGTFTIPSTQTPGIYRIRIASDGQGNVPAPCGPLVYSAEFEDYTLMVPNTSVDVAAGIMTSPGSFIIGNNTIGFKFANLHSTTVTSADIGYQLGSNTPVTQSLSSISVTQGSFYSATFSTVLNVPSAGTYTLRYWVTNPNSTGTGVSSNDTLYTTFTVCDPFNGTYTINPSGSGATNYTSFTAAISALTCGGVSGPVIFNVAAGTYNEQITLPVISGTSATNTITFQSASLTASSVTLSYAATGSGNYVINMNGADYVTFNRITISNTGVSGYYNVIQLANSSDYNTFRSCAISTSQTTSGYLVYQNNTTDKYNKFVSNTFTNGSAGVFLSGNSSTYPSNNTIDSNTFSNQYNYAVYSYYQDTVFIRNNTISSSSTTTYYGVYTYWNSRRPTISGNRMNISGTSTQYGLYLLYFNYSNGTSTNRGLIANNMISVGSGSASSYGIYFPSGYLQQYVDIVHNTVNVTTTGIGVALYVGNTLTGCNIANNIFQTNSSNASSYALQVTGTTYYSGTTSNYNNYYCTGTNQTYWGAVAYTTATFGTFQTTAAIDANSKNKQVYFTSSTDLHHSASCLAAAGTNAYFSLVGTDYDGVARNSTSPCIGATEFTTSAYDLAVSAITAPTTYSASAQTVSFTVRNNGTTTLTGFDAGYSVNYGTSTTQTFSSLSLGACDQTTLSFTTQVSLPTGISVLRVFNSGNLNGSNADANAANDTTYTQYSGGMSGIYTINPSAAPSNTNFQSFTTAITALSSTAGVTGPVTFNVSAGTYNEQLIIPAITGSSTTNTITFDGGSAASTTVTFAGTSTNYSVFRLSNTANITLKNMTIRNTGSSQGWGVHIYVTTTGSNLKVKNCILKNTAAASVTGTSSFAGIVASGSLTSPTTATSVVMSSIELDSNTVDSNYYGIIVYSSASYSSGVTVRRNTFTNTYFYGIYLQSLYGANVSNNTITLSTGTSTTSSYGIYLSSCNTTGSTPTYVNSNNIYGTGTYGIYLTSCAGSATAQCQLYNNMIRGGFRTTGSIGLYLSTVSYYNVYHNTVNMDFSTTGVNNCPVYQTGGTSSTCNIKNNIFAYTSSGGTGYGAYLTTVNNIDYNNYYKYGAGSSTIVAYYGGWGSLTQSSLSGGSQNANSISTNPNFTSATDLHVTDGCMLGTNLSVSTDFEGDSRSTTPTIGADEYARLNNDVGISALLYPSAPATPGTQQIIATLKNFGLNTVTSATVKYSVNNSTPVSVSWTGSLAPCGTTTITFTGANQYTFTGGTNVVKVWTESPNATTDARTSNDTNTTTLELCNGLSGAYTINPSGSGATNYTTFAAAVTALTNCGVSGPVEFTVSAGTYTEQISIGSISGASSTNTITFNGGSGNAATRILTYAGSTSTAAYTLRLNASPYVRFKNLTIRSTGATYANAVHIMGAAHYAQIKNCIVEITGTGATSTSSNYVPLIINNATDITSPSTGSQVNFLEIDSNTINAGYYSVYLYGSTSSPYSNSNKVRYNTLNSAYQYGFYFYFQDGMKFQNNTVAMRATGSSSSYGIYCSQSINSGTNYVEITGNKITDMGGYGMYLVNFSGSATYRNRIANNMIGGGFRTSGSYGVYLASAQYMDFWYNTINLDYNGGSSGTACLYSSSTSFMDARNNIFVVSATTGSAIPVYITTASDMMAFDYNNYVNSAGTTLIYYGGTNLISSTYQGFGSVNSNSMNVSMSFTSSTNLHHSNACLNGTAISSITTDYDGQTRGSTPDIGADEVSGVNNDLGVFSILSPTTGFTAGTQDVKVVIKNYGTNTITSGTVSYSVNGGTAVTQSWSGSLNSCDTAIVTFTGANQYTFAANTTYSLAASVSAPNGGTDNNSANNTYTISSLASGMSGTYTINPSGSGSTNFTTFNLAVTALANRGVSGAVTFNVSAATFTEQVTISSIPGISATNTVSFTGVSNTSSILSYSSSCANVNDHTLKVDNVQYVTFRNLYIKNTYSSCYPIAVQLYGSCHYTKIKNCILEVVASTSSSGFFPLLINSGVNTSNPSVGSYVYGLEIDSNTIKNGYYGIYMYGVTTTPYSNNNKFRYNTFTNAELYSAYFYYQDGLTFSNDSIYGKGSNSSSAGLYMTSCINTGSNYHVINSNKIYNNMSYGAYLGSCTSTSSSIRNQFTNNMIGGNTSSTTFYGTYFSSNTNFDIFFNSFAASTAITTAGYGAFYLTGGTGLDIRNNIFAHTNASATAVPFYSASTMSSVLLSASSFNYNNYYMANATTNRAYFNATTYTTTTLSGGGVSTYNTNSLTSVNPSFTSTTNLHVSTSTMNGVTISGYSTDIDGATRVNPPDMGADEIPNSVSSLDMAMDSIITPGNPNTTVGATTISVRLKNLGSTTLTGATIKYSVNNGTAVSQTWSGSLAQNATTTFSFTTTYTTSLGTVYSLKVWSEAPNSGTDAFMNNDTLTLAFTPKMSGTYTINGSGSGSTNFTTFALCSTALAVNGVSGPVTINVSPATYSGAVTITNISGASSTNTVTFDGGSYATTVLTATGISTALHTLRLDNTSYVHIRNMTIRGTSATYAWPMQIMSSSNVKVRNCLVDFVGGAGLPGASTNLIGILVNGNATSYSTSTTATNIDIDSNRVRGGYSGVMIYGSSSTGINVRNNTVDSTDTYGIYLSSGNGVTVSNNTVNMNPTGTATNYGIYLSSCTASGTSYHIVAGNLIKYAGYSGIYLTSSSNTAIYRGQLYNNMITDGFRTTGGAGIYNASSSYWNYYFNTVNFDQTNGYGVYLSGPSGMDIRNNMLVCSSTSSSSTALPLYSASLSYFNQLDYNNYYNAASGVTNLMVLNGSTTLTTTGFVGTNGYNSNSKNLAPSFVGAKNVHTTNACNNGVAISGITTDIDGNTRLSSPDIGADEVTASSNDLGVEAVVSPTAPLTAGAQNVVVRIKNYGGNTITSANVSYKVNGGAATTIAWTGSLAPCDTVSVTFSGANQYNFASGGSYSVKAYTDGPNGSTDANVNNDTVTTSTWCTGMSGTYTINPGGSGSTNYVSFAAAIAALQCGGVNGPVTFNVSAGTYSEQVVIPAITGASATNIITFDGGTASGTIIDWSASSTTAAHTLRIDNASYITVKNFTIHGSGSTYANPVHIYGSCNYVKVKNCVIDITGVGTTSTSSNFACVVINGSTTVSSTTGSRPTYLEIDSNTIQYGYYGIVSAHLTTAPHTTNLKFRKNSIEESYQYGLLVQNYVDTVYVNNNSVSLRTTGSTTAAGIYLSSVGGAGSSTYYCEIIGNKVINPGQYGIYASISNTSAATRSKVYNNMIGGGFRNTASYGFYGQSFYNIDFYYNTINQDAATTLEQYAAAYFNSCTGLDIRNNIFSVSNSAATGLPFYSVSGVTYNTFNYNNFYKAGTFTNLLYSQGAYLTTSTFVGSSGYNINSLNRSVTFTSTTDLHSNDAACFNGTAISGITTDYDNQSRGGTPDMGADEIPSYSNDVALDAIITPVAPLAAGTQDVKVRIRNAGNTTLTSATVNYRVNGGSVVSTTWTGTLVPCDTTTVTFTGANQYNFASGGTYVVQAFTSGANSTTDPNAVNDTITGSSLCTGYSGTYTINPSGSGSTNFTSFGAAVTALSCGGVTGPVTFNVSSGTYNEQVIIPALTGTSATNTVTFKSATGNAADVTLTYNSTITTSNYVVRFDGADYVNLKQMTLTATNTSFGRVIEIQNTSTYDSINTCVLNGIATITASTNFAVVFSNGTRDNGTVVHNNTINYGYYGVYWAGNSSAPYVTSATITDNTFTGQGTGGIYVQYHSKEYIKGNIISLHNSSASTFYGIQQNNSFNGARILKNKVTGTSTSATSTCYGIYSATGTATSTDSALIANNVVAIATSSGTNYGIFVQNNQWYKVYYNSVNITGSATSVYAAYLYSSSSTYQGNTALNNMFVNRCSGASAYAVYFYNTGVTSYFSTNYNNLWSSGTNLASNNGTNYTTLATWYASSGTPDVNSTNKLPGFTSSTDLHHSTSCINNTGTNLANFFAADDADGVSRSSTPDAGAYEFSGNAYDAAASSITSPTTWSASAQTVTFRVINRGSTTITSLTAGYNVNGGSVTSQTFTGLNIAACDSATLSFTTQVTLSAGQNVVKVFAAGNINSGNSDASASNDTSTVTFCSALSGTYTINASLPASGSNFQSFASAISALSSCGVSGAVTINVAAGTYNEQVTIPAVTGASGTNTITFNGADSATTIISYNTAISASRYVVKFNSARFTTLRNFRITSPNITQAWGIHIIGSAVTDTSNRIARCSVVLPAVNSTNFAGIVVSNSTTSAITTGHRSQAITIDSCSVTGGYYGITMMGYSTSPSQSPRNVIRGCSINNTGTYGIYAQYCSGLLVSGNTISNLGNTNSTTTTYGIYLSTCDSFQVLKSTITGQLGGYGIYAVSCAGISANHNLVANNMIQIGTSTNAAYGIYVNSGNYHDVVYNSVNVTSAALTSNVAALYATSATNTQVLNNNFVNLNNGYVVNLSPFTNTYFPTCDYNNYYGLGTNPLNGSYANASAMSGALYTGSDSHSKSVNPNFTSSTNLHTPSATALNAAATPFAGITDDYDGVTRDATTPDIGCDEFTPPSDDMGVIAITKPVAPVAAGNSDVWVVIKNYASATLTAATVKYMVGATTYSQSWTGSLATNATDTVKFTATSGAGSSSQQTNFASASNTIVAYSEGPNGNTDGILSNDTLTYTFCLGMSGTYTINPSGSGSTNYTSITAAIAALQCGGVSGPVVFNISSGTYTGQYIIPSIAGASSTNTITFQSAAGVASAVTLQNNSTVSANYIVRLYAADYIKFSRVTFSAQNSTYGQCIELTANGTDYATNNTVQYCTLNANSTGTTCSGIYCTPTTNPNSLTIYGNTFLNGAYGVYLSGVSGTIGSMTTGLLVDSNYFGTSAANSPASQQVYAWYAYSPQITRNTFYSRSTSTTGVYCYYSSTNFQINRNLFNFALGGTAIDLEYANINNGETSGGTIVNNAISLGGTSTARGIYIYSSGLVDVVYNSIYSNSSLGNSISNVGVYTYGSSTSTHKNVSLYNNNVFSASSYALYVDGSLAANATGAIDTSNYNNWYSTGTNLAYVYPTNYTPANFTTFKGTIYTGSDANSVSGNPGFTSSTNLTPNSNSGNAWTGHNMGTQVTWISTDINGNSRSTTVATGGTDLGAYAYAVPTATPNTLTTTGSHTNNGTDTLWFNGKKVGYITWGASGTIPSITGYFYPGSWPDTTGLNVPGSLFYNGYWKVSATGGSGFTYDITLYYDPAQLGTVSSPANARMGKRPDSGGGWTTYLGSLTTVNTTTQTITVTGLNSFSQFTITDQNNPLPVEWVSFTANRSKNDVVLDWTTALEINNDHFDIERSTDGVVFTNVGEQAGHGTVSTPTSYNFTDNNAALLPAAVLYYRLKQVDHNGTFSYSKVVAVDLGAKQNSHVEVVYPTFFSTTLHAQLTMLGAETVNCTITDQFGRTVLEQKLEAAAGTRTYELQQVDRLATGVYFVELRGSTFSQRFKVIKD